MLATLLKSGSKLTPLTTENSLGTLSVKFLEHDPSEENIMPLDREPYDDDRRSPSQSSRKSGSYSRRRDDADNRIDHRLRGNETDRLNESRDWSDDGRGRVTDPDNDNRFLNGSS
jgi:hypothetical protein